VQPHPFNRLVQKGLCSLRIASGSEPEIDQLAVGINCPPQVTPLIANTDIGFREICETRVRYGYRRVHVLLDREGWDVNVKKVYRIYKELRMQLRNKTPKRRV